MAPVRYRQPDAADRMAGPTGGDDRVANGEALARRDDLDSGNRERGAARGGVVGGDNVAHLGLGFGGHEDLAGESVGQAPAQRSHMILMGVADDDGALAAQLPLRNPRIDVRPTAAGIDAHIEKKRGVAGFDAHGCAPLFAQSATPRADHGAAAPGEIQPSRTATFARAPTVMAAGS